jgi:hypothetical protein
MEPIEREITLELQQAACLHISMQFSFAAYDSCLD